MKNKNWIKLISESYIRLNEADYGLAGRGAKLVHTNKGETHSAKIYKLPDTGEFAVHFFKGSQHMGEDSVAYETDLSSAKATAEASIKRLQGLKTEAFSQEDYTRIHPLGSAIIPETFAKMSPNERLQLGVFAREQGHTVSHEHLLNDKHFRKGYGSGPAEYDYMSQGAGPG
jgi:hypothetical protein